MALHSIESDGQYRLSAYEKFRMLRAKSRVEVKLTKRVGRVVEPLWVTARIINTNKGGAYCLTADSKECFYHWNDVRPPASTPEENQPFSTLGDVARFPNEKESEPAKPALRAVPPYLDQAPTSPQTSPPPQSGPRASALLISRDDLRREQELSRVEMPPKKKPGLVAHKLNAISHQFREQRMSRGWSQIQLADSLSSKTRQITNQEISRIELGKARPSDELLIAFSELFALDLAKLIEMRDPSTATGPAPALAGPPGLPESVVVAPAPAPAPEPVPPTRNGTPVEGTRDFALFTLNLCEVSPLPFDKDRRKLWLALAVKLFELGEP